MLIGKNVVRRSVQSNVSTGPGTGSVRVLGSPKISLPLPSHENDRLELTQSNTNTATWRTITTITLSGTLSMPSPALWEVRTKFTKRQFLRAAPELKMGEETTSKKQAKQKALQIVEIPSRALRNS